MTSAAGMFLFLLRLRLVGWGPKSPGFFLVRVLDGKRSAGGAERVQESTEWLSSGRPVDQGISSVFVFPLVLFCPL